MEFWLWVLIGILIIIIVLLIAKICILKKSADEIADGFADRLASDTNTLISISSRDRHMRNLAKKINIELSKLKKDRQRFQQGDLELKEAVTNISHDLPHTSHCSLWLSGIFWKKKNVPPTLRAISELYGTARKRSLSSPKSCSDIPSSPRYQTELPRSRSY